MNMLDIINSCRQKIKVDASEYEIFNPRLLKKAGFNQIDKLPFSIIILLEQVLRNFDGRKVREQDITNLARWNKTKLSEDEIPFMPTRVVLQDFTGVPSLVDLAALRSALDENNLPADLINPKVPVDLIIDHSIQVDQSGTPGSLAYNMQIEFERNKERYEFLKWGQNAFQNFRVFPPGAGIIHQVNLEHLSPVVHVKNGVCFPDTLVGTDSHTPMINGLGVVGWGVGGIEAESAMLGQPIYMSIPEVIGVKLYNKLDPQVTATDLVLRITQMLRQKGVVEKFVEFFGPGLDSLTLVDRATISNMSPEYGATIAYFPVDAETLTYMRKTGRPSEIIDRTQSYYQTLGLFRDSKSTQDPIFTDTIELDLSTVAPSIAGPKRPQDRINLKDAKIAWKENLVKPVKDRGFELLPEKLNAEAKVQNTEYSLKHGSVVIAAITSCTNTSNPSLMIAAGLVAKKASEYGLQIKPWVKTSFAPGSRVVTDYLEKAQLLEYLNTLGFNIVGYGCTTCIGNSGPLRSEIDAAIRQNELVVCSVLSGNRNFEGRIHASIKANFLASPPLVVIYALAGTMNIDLFNDPLAVNAQGKSFYLKDLWPTPAEISALEKNVTSDLYTRRYETVHAISDSWTKIKGKNDKVFNWNEESTYIQKPPFFKNISTAKPKISAIENARVLLKLGDSITTDHISPAGGFSSQTPAGQYLLSKNVDPVDFNSYGARRGNDRIMERATFANIRIRNQLVDQEGGFTLHFPTNKVLTIFDAAQKYKQSNIPTIIVAGAEYGSGSSRDWAAKGTYLLGVKAVIAVSYERIHRSNLVGMGVLPLEFMDGQNAETLKLTGTETFSIVGLSNSIAPKAQLEVTAADKKFKVLCRLDTEIEIEYYRNNGILHKVLREIMHEAQTA